MASDSLVPLMAMIIVQIGFAGMNILSKVVIDSGMSPFVLATYRQTFATFAISPVAYFMERNTRPRITLAILFQIFLCSLFGATMNSIFYYLGLKNASPTITCALNNLLPAVTFFLAVPFRLESVGIRRMPGKAKVAGTILCVGGAMLLSFYHGDVIDIGESAIPWKYAEDITKHHSVHKPNFLLGSVLVVGSCTGWAIWLIVQAKMSEFQAPYTSSALMCFMAAIETGIIGICFEHNIPAWSLRSKMRLITSLYVAIVSSAISFCIISWCIHRKGPLYASVFSPLQLVLVTVLSWALLREKLYVGIVIGSVLIVCGLYAFLWGKNKELKEKLEDGREDLELQVHVRDDSEK